MNPGEPIWILYKNWRSVTRWRHVLPRTISFEATVHHPEAQWLLHATCLEKNVPRSFALLDIARFSTTGPSA